MAEYAKPWLSVDEQIDRLAGHRVEIEDRGRAASIARLIPAGLVLIRATAVA